MLSRKQQQKYLAKRIGEWQTHLQEFTNSHNPETLHQLRVALKKLKALARFSKACSGSNAVKDANGLKKMFKQAGIIRDAGNHLHLLEQFHPVAEPSSQPSSQPSSPSPSSAQPSSLPSSVSSSQQYKEQQEQVQTKATAKFIRHIKQYRRQGKRAGKRLLADLDSIPVDCIRDWFALQLVTTGILLTSSGDRLHKARKQIKDLLYIQKLLPAPAADVLHLDTEYLDKLQDAIGQWHDAAVIVAAWAGQDSEDSPAMTRKCREKEAAVRHLAKDFYLRAHRTSPR